MSTRNRLKRLEKLSGAVEAPARDSAIHLIAAWLACKLERFEELRDEYYVAPTDEQRALVAKTSYERIVRAFAIAAPLRRYITYLNRRARDTTETEAFLGPPDES